MKNITPAFFLYITSGLIYLISALLGYDYLVFVSKPIIASSMMFHYWFETKGKINIWHLLFLFLYFWSGILNLFEDSQTLLYVLIVNIIAYSILLSLVVKRVLEVNFRNIDNVSFVYILLTIVFLATLVYVCLGLVFSKEDELYSYFTVYAIVLTSLAIGSTVLYTLKHSNAIVYLLLASFCYVICDLFYIIYYYYYDFYFFRLLSILSSVISYYFVVNYFIKSKENLSM